ncbi:MAG TPA: hypothetical protein VF636_04185 [Sphingomonas sp.]
MLMQERIDALRTDVAKQARDLETLTGKVFEIDKRVVRIETMIEMSARAAGQPRIEG